MVKHYTYNYLELLLQASTDTTVIFIHNSMFPLSAADGVDLRCFYIVYLYINDSRDFSCLFILSQVISDSNYDCRWRDVYRQSIRGLLRSRHRAAYVYRQVVKTNHRRRHCRYRHHPFVRSFVCSSIHSLIRIFPVSVCYSFIRIMMYWFIHFFQSK